jgi:hypothetical protein
MIVDLIIFVFVLTRWVFIGLILILMSLEGVRIIHRRPIGVSTVLDPHFRHKSPDMVYKKLRNTMYAADSKKII